MIRHIITVSLGFAFWPILCIVYQVGAIFYTLPMAIRLVAKAINDDYVERIASLIVYGQSKCPKRRVITFE